jgi:hypothetical protein
MQEILINQENNQFKVKGKCPNPSKTLTTKKSKSKKSK